MSSFKVKSMKNYYIDKCLEFENTYLDYPFSVSDWAAIRHSDNKKIFALIYSHYGKVCINFKNKPEWATFWRESFDAVQPAYHMNKEHWSMVTIGEDASEEQILQMLYDSYNLTKTKTRRKK